MAILCPNCGVVITTFKFSNGGLYAKADGEQRGNFPNPQNDRYVEEQHMWNTDPGSDGGELIDDLGDTPE